MAICNNQPASFVAVVKDNGFAGRTTVTSATVQMAGTRRKLVTTNPVNFNLIIEPSSKTLFVTNCQSSADYECFWNGLFPESGGVCSTQKTCVQLLPSPPNNAGCLWCSADFHRKVTVSRLQLGSFQFYATITGGTQEDGYYTGQGLGSFNAMAGQKSISVYPQSIPFQYVGLIESPSENAIGPWADSTLPSQCSPGSQLWISDECIPNSCGAIQNSLWNTYNNAPDWTCTVLQTYASAYNFIQAIPNMWFSNGDIYHALDDTFVISYTSTSTELGLAIADLVFLAVGPKPSIGQFYASDGISLSMPVNKKSGWGPFAGRVFNEAKDSFQIVNCYAVPTSSSASCSIPPTLCETTICFCGDFYLGGEAGKCTYDCFSTAELGVCSTRINTVVNFTQVQPPVFTTGGSQSGGGSGDGGGGGDGGDGDSSFSGPELGSILGGSVGGAAILSAIGGLGCLGCLGAGAASIIIPCIMVICLCCFLGVVGAAVVAGLAGAGFVAFKIIRKSKKSKE
jgi:hypothetical protein